MSGDIGESQLSLTPGSPGYHGDGSSPCPIICQRWAHSLNTHTHWWLKGYYRSTCLLGGASPMVDMIFTHTHTFLVLMLIFCNEVVYCGETAFCWSLSWLIYLNKTVCVWRVMDSYGEEWVKGRLNLQNSDFFFSVLRNRFYQFLNFTSPPT